MGVPSFQQLMLPALKTLENTGISEDCPPKWAISWATARERVDFAAIKGSAAWRTRADLGENPYYRNALVLPHGGLCGDGVGRVRDELTMAGGA
jgi:hypothetical protein